MPIPGQVSPFLSHYAWRYKAYLIPMALTMLVWAVNEALFPYFIKMIVDQTQCLIPGKQPLWNSYKLPLMGLAITWLAMQASMRLYGVLAVYLFPKFCQTMRYDVFDYVKQQSVMYFSNNLGGTIGTRIRDIPRTSQYILEHLLWQIIPITCTFFISTFVLMQTSVLFSTVLLVWGFSHIGVTFYYLGELRTKISDHYEADTVLNGEIQDIIMNALPMKFFARIPFETIRLDRFQAKEISASIRASWAQQKVHFIREILSLAFIAVILYLLIKGWDQGWLTAGDFPLVAMTCFNLLGLLWILSHTLLDLSRDSGLLKGALAIVREPIAVKDLPTAKPLQVTAGTIRFENVYFGYRSHDLLFQNLNLELKAGEKVGLVGFSGSGKTTFINLILRAFDVIDGRILIDGQDIRQVTQHSLYDQIGIIPQDPSLFHRSIAENIAYGKPGATAEEIERAAELAHCTDFIDRLPDKYQTMVGERGMKLSGGQRQRLSIARCILKNAPILILDEATSALDSVTEQHIQESLEYVMQNRTTIVVAHRLSTLKNMDRIIVFHRGAIVEDGAPKTLLKKKGHFAKLWQMQEGGFIPDTPTEGTP